MEDKYNADLANRQAQINEWHYNNKMDTLFVFQLLFISLMIVTVLMVLKSQGVVGGLFVWYTAIILLVIMTLIIANRSSYTRVQRDSQFWNKRHFEGDNKEDSPVSRGDVSYVEYVNDVQAAYGDGGGGGGGGGGDKKCKCPT